MKKKMLRKAPELALAGRGASMPDPSIGDWLAAKGFSACPIPPPRTKYDYPIERLADLLPPGNFHGVKCRPRIAA